MRQQKPSNDPRLLEIAKTFHALPPFPDPEEFGEHLRDHDSKSFRHYSIMPGRKILGARFFMKGRNRYVAYATHARQLDLLRFADMATMRLWKFMSRSQHREVADGDLNFPVSLVQRDLDDFETDRPDIIAMLDAIQHHFLEIGLIRDRSIPLDPALDPRKKNRKTARSEFMLCHKAQMTAAEQRHQELLDLIASLHERLDGMTKRLDGTATVKVHPVEFPKDPINPEWEKLGPGADIRLPHEDDFKPLDVKPLAPGTVVEVPPMIFLPKPNE